MFHQGLPRVSIGAAGVGMHHTGAFGAGRPQGVDDFDFLGRTRSTSRSAASNENHLDFLWSLEGYSRLQNEKDITEINRPRQRTFQFLYFSQNTSFQSRSVSQQT